MRTKILAVAALAIATIGPPAAIAATGTDVKIAIERTATQTVDPGSWIVRTIEPAWLRVADGGKLDVVSLAIPAAAVPSSPPVAVAAAGVARDRDPVAYHRRL